MKKKNIINNKITNFKEKKDFFIEDNDNNMTVNRKRLKYNQFSYGYDSFTLINIFIDILINIL